LIPGLRQRHLPATPDSSCQEVSAGINCQADPQGHDPIGDQWINPHHAALEKLEIESEYERQRYACARATPLVPASQDGQSRSCCRELNPGLLQ